MDDKIVRFTEEARRILERCEQANGINLEAA